MTQAPFESDEKQDAAPSELMTKDVISLIKLLPDELPCHLAGLCRLSCRDVSHPPDGSFEPNAILRSLHTVAGSSLSPLLPARFIMKPLTPTPAPRTSHGLVRSVEHPLPHPLNIL